MKTADDIVRSLALRIGRIYYHPLPLMYGRTPEELDSLLFLYHELWCEIVEREDELNRHLVNTLGFAIPYARKHPEATEPQVAQEVVREWSAVSESLGVPTPHERLRREFSAP